MQTILVSSTATLFVDKSRFIGVTFHIENADDIEKCLKDIRLQYPKAKHYCYAYVLGQNEKGYDDGEPSKTAGRPLLELLKRGEYDETLLVVVRYFGGALLGASRLLRTYVAVASETLSKGEKSQIVSMFTYRVRIAYSGYDFLLSEAKKHSYILENATFSDTIDIKLLSVEKADENLKAIFHDIIEITALLPEKRYIKETTI
ncbi:MAG: YigZ family protein [Bacteroidia bacterium]|nr:YigZ family protein [Bacteroidia bacterium]